MPFGCTPNAADIASWPLGSLHRLRGPASDMASSRHIRYLRCFIEFSPESPLTIGPVAPGTPLSSFLNVITRFVENRFFFVHGFRRTGNSNPVKAFPNYKEACDPCCFGNSLSHLLNLLDDINTGQLVRRQMRSVGYNVSNKILTLWLCWMKFPPIDRLSCTRVDSPAMSLESKSQSVGSCDHGEEDSQPSDSSAEPSVFLTPWSVLIASSSDDESNYDEGSSIDESEISGSDGSTDCVQKAQSARQRKHLRWEPKLLSPITNSNGEGQEKENEYAPRPRLSIAPPLVILMASILNFARWNAVMHVSRFPLASAQPPPK